MQKIIIFGAESTGIKLGYKILNREYIDFNSAISHSDLSYSNKAKCVQSVAIGEGDDINIKYFIDNNSNKWGENLELIVDNVKYNFIIKSPNDIINDEFDKIIIASYSGCDAIVEQLVKNYGISRKKISNEYCKISLISRLIFLETFSKCVNNYNLNGSVAELGVFQGDFAKKINQFFPKKTLYLFDTFEGFDARDLLNEELSVRNLGGHLVNTSVDLVRKKMPHPENVVIKQGWFPSTATDLEDEKFCFVNIDTDLYDSILSGLEFFYPKMVAGGIILVHDYFSLGYIGVKKAVDEFCHKNNINCFPIGDDISIAMQKK
ncbi:methyltransferase [Campylobacter jejuni]|nr:methyltransferase [Campylobacter jejuni]ECQ7461245.1 methyltransferase [Campylobacter jejuni]ECQ9161858.1 methyltransferase [Campylobacter jejuni]EDP4524840.1 methyltransferase [Campylobacter jejuni]